MANETPVCENCGEPDAGVREYDGHLDLCPPCAKVWKFDPSDGVEHGKVAK